MGHQRDGDPPVLTESATVHRHAATESFCLEPYRKNTFGFFVLSYTVTLCFPTLEYAVCSRQVHRYFLRYTKHL
jgi:hypothetical protein